MFTVVIRPGHTVVTDSVESAQACAARWATQGVTVSIRRAHADDCTPGNCEVTHAIESDALLPDLGCTRDLVDAR